MKFTRHNVIGAAVLAISIPFANAQTLGSAANYDIFAVTGGKITLEDSGQLFGQVGVSNSASLEVKEEQNFRGTVFAHSGSEIKGRSMLNPSGGIQTSPSVDSALNQANTDLLNYSSYLAGLTADATFTDTYKDSYSLTTMMSLTVIDFQKIDTQNQVFSFTGRAGEMDQIIIRIDEEFKFDGGNVQLTNLDASNVIFYLDSDKKFDLHKGFSTFSGTVVAPFATVILGETDFTGAVYGRELKLGSGFDFTGNTVPEPSSSVMMLVGAASLLLVRRRKQS